MLLSVAAILPLFGHPLDMFWLQLSLILAVSMFFVVELLPLVPASPFVLSPGCQCMAWTHRVQQLLALHASS